MHLTEAQLEELLLGRLGAGTAAARIGCHLDACPSCRRQLRELREFVRALQAALAAS